MTHLTEEEYRAYAEYFSDILTIEPQGSARDLLTQAGVRAFLSKSAGRGRTRQIREVILVPCKGRMKSVDLLKVDGALDDLVDETLPSTPADERYHLAERTITDMLRGY